jgi:SAM-dependent methyltransferase
MDLRDQIRSSDQLAAAKRLGTAGLLCYQPFIFDESYEVGVGWEFTKGEFAGLIHWPDPPAEHLGSPSFRRLLVSPDEVPQFRAANQRLRTTYDGFVDAICARLGDISSLSFLDVGCNSGYLPLSFARRGVKLAVGVDRENYADTFALLNGILGTQAEFRRASYDPHLREIPATEKFDVVSAMLVLCHLPDPLNFLAFLGRTARRALFLWNGVTQERALSLSFGPPGRYYGDVPFPDCFDYDTRPSTGLLRQSLELMGFTEIYQLPPAPGGLAEGHYYDKRPILALRPDVPGDSLASAVSRLYPAPGAGIVEPKLLGSLWHHNVVAFKGRIYGVPFGVPVDWSDPRLGDRIDLIVGQNVAEICDRIEWG